MPAASLLNAVANRCAAAQPGVVAYSCNPATRRLEFADVLGLGLDRDGCHDVERASARGSPSACAHRRSPTGCRLAKAGRTGSGGLTQQPKAPVASGSGTAPVSRGADPTHLVWTDHTLFILMPPTCCRRKSRVRVQNCNQTLIRLELSSFRRLLQCPILFFFKSDFNYA